MPSRSGRSGISDYSQLHPRGRGYWCRAASTVGCVSLTPILLHTTPYSAPRDPCTALQGSPACYQAFAWVYCSERASFSRREASAAGDFARLELRALSRSSRGVMQHGWARDRGVRGGGASAKPLVRCVNGRAKAAESERAKRSTLAERVGCPPHAAGWDEPLRKPFYARSPAVVQAAARAPRHRAANKPLTSRRSVLRFAWSTRSRAARSSRGWRLRPFRAGR